MLLITLLVWRQWQIVSTAAVVATVATGASEAFVLGLGEPYA
jgi:hypothetical protein